MSKENITAQYLRSLADSADLNVDWILERCHAEAEGGETSYYHHGTLNNKQKEYIMSKGFKLEFIEGQPSLEDIYRIKW